MSSKLLRHRLRQTTTHTTVFALIAAISTPMMTFAPALATDSTIDSAVTTTNGGATLNGNDSLTITQSGSITKTSGDGVFVEGNNNEITNSGTITTDGNGGEGIRANYTNDAIITNSGAISTGGSNAEGIEIYYGKNAVVTNSGSIATGGSDAEGIETYYNNNATITNSGTISTGGSNAEGIEIYYSNNVVATNSGSIATGGNGAEGIEVTGSNNAAITNSGSISTTGSGAEGIRFYYGNGATITNSGSITTIQNNAEGIEIYHNNNTTITNSGSIKTDGNGADGMLFHYSDSATITNSGSITTGGSGADGMYFYYSDNATITNSGSIVTNESGAAGISLHESSNNTITVSGSVIARNADAFLFDNNSSNTTLNLNAPAFIGGAFNLGSGTKLNIKTAKSHSFAWTFDTTQLLGGAPVSITGPVPTFQQTTGNTLTITTFDPTTLGTTFESLAGRTGLLSGVTRSRLSSSEPTVLSYAETATTIIDDAFAEVETTNQGWAKVVSSFAEYEGDATIFDSNHRQLAVVAGYDWSLSGDTVLGFMAGYAKGSVTSDSNFANSVDNDTKGLFVGAYGRTEFDNMFLRYGLTAGMDSHTDDRLVNDNLMAGGLARAVAQYDSFWVSPEITYGITYDLGDDWMATPSVRLSYAGQWIDGYTETGTSANATIGERQVGVAELNLDYAATLQLAASALTGRIGYAYRASVGDSTTDVTLLGTTQALVNNSADRHIAYLGGEALFNINDALELEIAAQVEFSQNHTAGNGSLKLTSKF